MSKQVYCRKYQQSLPALQQPPFAGPAGQAIYEQVSQQAWDEWLQQQTRLINELQLNLRDAQARAYLSTQRERFLDNLPYDQAQGYTPG